jgi:hypothetical protein
MSLALPFLRPLREKEKPPFFLLSFSLENRLIAFGFKCNQPSERELLFWCSTNKANLAVASDRCAKFSAIKLNRGAAQAKRNARNRAVSAFLRFERVR